VPLARPVTDSSVTGHIHERKAMARLGTTVGVILGFCASAALPWLLRAASQATTVHYAIDLRRADGAIGIVVDVESVPAGTGVSAVLADKLFGLESIVATRRDTGEAVPLVHTERWAKTGKTESLFSYYTLPVVDSGLRLSYTVRPRLRQVGFPCGEQRHVALRAADYCYLTGPSCLLLPNRLAKASISINTPPDWNLLSTFPATVSGATAHDAVWRWGLAAGPFRQATYLCVEIATHASVPDSVTDTVQRLLTEIQCVLGAPTRALGIALVPRSSDWMRLEQSTMHDMIVSDVERSDVGSIKQLVRQLVMHWYGAGEPKSSWSLHGVAELLARTIPATLDLDNTSPIPSLEFTWMRDRDRAAQVDLAGPFTYWHGLKSELVIHEINTVVAAAGGTLAEILRGWDGVQPIRVDRSNRAAAAVNTILERASSPSPFFASFEDRWAAGTVPKSSASARSTPSSGKPVREVRILVSANTEGYLENCGCKVNQSGGLARRVAAIKAAQREGTVTVVDLGNFLPVRAKSPVLDPFVKAELPLHLEAMRNVGYAAVCIGTNEVVGDPDSISLLRSCSGVPFLDAGLLHKGQSLGAPHVVALQGDIRLGIVGLTEKLNYGPLRESHEKNAGEARFPSGAAHVAKLLPGLREQVDLVVVVGRFSVPTEMELRGLGVDVSINAEGGYEIWRDPCYMQDATLVVHEDASSYGLTDLRIEIDEARRPIGGRVTRIDLPQDMAGDTDVLERINQHYASLTPTSADVAQLRPLFGWDEWAQKEYVGEAACKNCHPGEHKQWLMTPHSTAMATLRSRGRDRNPSCVQCHVLGLGRDDGYRIGGGGNELAGVQCESCHGAGGSHVAAPSKANIRKSPSGQVCRECHDDKHSDGFEQRWEAAWKAVSHR
jgi:nitrate/TMAO reductase-like tetraheme cytochrome c subunit